MPCSWEKSDNTPLDRTLRLYKLDWWVKKFSGIDAKRFLHRVSYCFLTDILTERVDMTCALLSSLVGVHSLITSSHPPNILCSNYSVAPKRRTNKNDFMMSCCLWCDSLWGCLISICVSCDWTSSAIKGDIMVMYLLKCPDFVLVQVLFRFCHLAVSGFSTLINSCSNPQNLDFILARIKVSPKHINPNFMHHPVIYLRLDTAFRLYKGNNCRLLLYEPGARSKSSAVTLPSIV